MITLNNKNFFIGVLFLSFISIVSAIYIEYIIGIKPCALCIYQRLPYIFAIFICSLGINSPTNLFWSYLVILIFLINILLSGYHVGIENGFFSEFTGCKNNNLQIVDKESLLEAIKNQNISCKDVSFRIFGFSLATINLIISLTVLLLAIILIKNVRNK